MNCFFWDVTVFGWWRFEGYWELHTEGLLDIGGEGTMIL